MCMLQASVQQVYRKMKTGYYQSVLETKAKSKANSLASRQISRYTVRDELRK